MVKVTTIGGYISPKSVVASGTGLFVAQNMMYQHTVTVYNDQFELVATVSDSVDLSEFGFSQYPGISRGAPVEAAFMPGGKHVYVSNYSMYGRGHGPEGTDECETRGQLTPSFVYRIDMETFVIDQAIEVGKVPKYLAVTPDGQHLLVTNWCGNDMSVVDTATQQVVRTVPLQQWPRGIAVSPDSTTAYVANFGTSNVAIVDIATGDVEWINNVGRATRHVNVSPDGQFLYVTCNNSGYVAKIDLRHPDGPTVVATVHTGTEPRSSTLASDGLHLYVVNYESNTMSVIETTTMTVTQTIPTGDHPIGITYDPQTANVWLANYSGTIVVYEPAQ
jgi:YVTN family beta-propeller protein